jgi:insulysin
VPNPKEVNSSLAYYCHVGYITQRELRAVNGLLLHMMREPTFNELRTKQQLGYVVFVTKWHSRGSIGLRFLLQSEREPVYLESRVEAFLDAYKDQLAATTPEEFEKQKEGLISQKLEKLENLHGEITRFWTHITSGYCNFLQRE